TFCNRLIEQPVDDFLDRPSILSTDISLVEHPVDDSLIALQRLICHVCSARGIRNHVQVKCKKYDVASDNPEK
ncbi:hypothetical protein L9F63_021361, partial [Diploptera punctata]